MEYKTMRDKSVILDEKGKIIAEVDYPAAGENYVHMKRTFVNGDVREHGVASRLLKEAALYLRAEGKKVIPTCSYAVKWFEKHPEFKDILK